MCSTHAFGAAFDNPDLIVVAVVGDGEAETGPLEGSWKSIEFPQSGARWRGAAHPAPEWLQDFRPDRAGPRQTMTTCAALLAGHGYDVHLRRGRRSHERASGLRRDAGYLLREDPRYPGDARETRLTQRPPWPAIVLRTPKGWTGPKVVDGMPIEGTFRAHQVPLADVQNESRASGDSRGMDAELPARRALRRAGPLRP